MLDRRPRDGYRAARRAVFTVAVLEECGVRVELGVAEVLGYGEAHGEAFKALLEQVVAHLAEPLHDQMEREYAEAAAPGQVQADLCHAVLFFIGPTSRGLSSKDREFLASVRDLALVVPLLAKADCYTPEELRERRWRLRRELEELGVGACPLALDALYGGLGEQLEARFPLATVASTHRLKTPAGLVRARAYPWGHVDVDDAACSDLGLLQDMLFRSLFVALHDHAYGVAYEGYRRASLGAFQQLYTPEQVQAARASGDRLRGSADARPEKPPGNKIDMIAKKALERLRLSSSAAPLPADA